MKAITRTSPVFIKLKVVAVIKLGSISQLGMFPTPVAHKLGHGPG